MAGNSKPNIPNLGKEASYQVLSLVGSQGSGGTVQLPGLFDGNNPNEWNTDKVMYWQTADHFIEINISSPKVNIWRSGTTDWKSYINSLKIKYWNGSLYVDVTANYPQTVTQITEKQWEKTISNLPSGRYRFEYGTERRLDSEWFIETSPSNKILLSSGGRYYSTFKEYIDETNSFVPILTSSVDPSGFRTSSSASTDNSWKAFARSTAWQSGTTSGWLRIQLPLKTVIGGFSMMGWANTTQNTSKIVFRGSNDGINWTVLDTFQSITWTINTRKYFTIKNESEYSYYEFSDLVSGANLTMSDIELYRRKSSNVTLITPSLIEELDYIRYGSSEVKNELITKVKSLTKENTQLGTGKTFEHTIDMSKRRVDKITLG